MQEVYDFLKKCGTYYLATTEGDQPRVRPFGTILIFENRLYIQTGKKKPTSHQIAVNPKVEICACSGEQWIRIAAVLVEDERIEAQKAMLDQYPSLQKVYQPGDGNTQVFYLKYAEATLASITGESKLIRF